jgi:serine phosphatase RsbU (regulator of sigma subunit)
MDYLINHMNIYMIPPAMSLVIGILIVSLSLLKGGFKQENILFALVIIWLNLLPPVFILHHVFWGDVELVLKIERTFHFFYVYLPFVILLYVHTVYMRMRKIVIFSFLLSMFLSFSTFTHYYFYGLFTYSWGYIAKGGPAFQIFGAYAMFGFLYSFFIFRKMYTRETNNTIKLKIKFILFSLLLIILLTLCNIPAINGIDFYPLGNFMFIPLSILAYGVLKHRIMDIKSILHITLIWAITSSLIILPNIMIYILIKPYFSLMTHFGLFGILLLWFIINYLYIKKNQPKIDQLFNKRKFNLHAVETAFIDNISMLKSLRGTIEEFIEVIKKTLGFSRAKLILRVTDTNNFSDENKDILEMDPDIELWFVGDNQPVERDMVNANPYFSVIKEKLIGEFNRFNSDYIIPLVHNGELIAILFLPEKINLKPLTKIEIKFINNIRTAVVISLSNAKMYQNLSDLKDNLEDRVLKRTEELMFEKEKVEAMNETLIATNENLENAKIIAERDMKMAVNVQKSILPKEAPKVKGWDIAYAFQPMSGVSGDLYDFYHTDDTLNGIALFDVSGHGIASGLITMIAKPIIHRFFTRMKNSKLNKVLQRANEDLVEEIGNVDNYLTGIILKFNGDKDQVEYVNAGHPDLMLRNKDRSVREVNDDENDFKGMFLGFKEFGSKFESLKFEMNAGEELLLFSDCIIEGKNSKNEEYGTDALMKSFSRAPDGSAEEILFYITNEFMKFIDHRNLDDDYTVIIIKKT